MWTFEPGVIISLAAAALVYAWLTVRASRAGCRVSWPRVTSFVAGWVALVVALISPLDQLSESLFSAHMIQHELLMVVAAPLIVLGSGVVLLPGSGVVSRILWLRIGSGPVSGVRADDVAGTIPDPVRKTTPDPVPAVVWIVHAVALWAWHIPALFDAALESDAIHAAQHLSFFGTAVLFWWGLAGRHFGRTAYGASVLYVFTTALHSGVLGALLTFSRRVWYVPYTLNHPAGLTPLEDQQLAGLLMWIPAGLIFVVGGLSLFAAWLRQSDRLSRLR
jgi:putative membrane protein